MQEEKTVNCKCLNPTYCWICGTTICKADGVLSPRLEFSEHRAWKYFRQVVRDGLLRPEFGHDKMARKLMQEKRLEVPCGKCHVCQIEKRKAMSLRLTHESSQYENSCFITLTYDEENVPCTNSVRGLASPEKKIVRGFDFDTPHLTLLPSDVQKFMKRLRRHLSYVPKTPDGRDHVERLRYFAVGEYGSKTHRPHYHIIIFGWKPSDADLLFMKDGRPVFTSKQLQKCWKFGFSSYCNVTPYVAKYCARYVTKKYARLENPAWEDKFVVPEFTLQSTSVGGIGATWFDKFGAAACKVGFCTYRMGERILKAAIPKYYWTRLRKKNLPLWLDLRDDKLDFIKHHKCLSYKVSDLKRMCDCALLQHSYFANKETF